MPISKTQLRKPCASCGGKINCAEADALCHGCKLIVCEECTYDYDHSSYFGSHGLKDPELKVRVARADNLRERDRQFGRQYGN